MTNIKGHENYNITKDGKVINNKTNVVLKQKIDRYGYYKVGLSNNGKIKTIRVHRLLALTYLPNPENKCDVNHIDGNKSNNDLSNLEWATRSENIKHAFKNGLKIITNKQRLLLKERCSKRVLDTQTGIFYNSAVEASIILGINENTLYGYLSGANPNKTSLRYE
jgi:hypothetical protein